MRVPRTTSPRLPPGVTALSQWLDEHEYASVQQMRGSLSHRNAADPSAFERESYLNVLESFAPPPGVRY